MKWTVPSSLGMTYNDKGRGVGLVWQALKYALTNKGLLGLPASPIRAYIRTRAGLDAPDAAISWIPFLADANFKLAKDSGITAIMNILRSESTGSMHITSKAPNRPPAIRFNFLTAQLDREVGLSGMQGKKHIHLIGICGTAMASLAGLLQLRGHRITGSDKAAYPPMSDLLHELHIPVLEPTRRATSMPGRPGRGRQCALARQP